MIVQSFGVDGTPDFGVDTPDFGVGTPDFGVGTPDFGVGTPDFGVDTPQPTPYTQEQYQALAQRGVPLVRKTLGDFNIFLLPNEGNSTTLRELFIFRKGNL